MNVSDRQTQAHTERETQTPHDDIGHAYASHRVAKINGSVQCKRAFHKIPIDNCWSFSVGPHV